MTFDDTVELVNQLGEKLTKLAYLKDELAQIPDKHIQAQAVELSNEIYDMLEELEESGLSKIYENLGFDD